MAGNRFFSELTANLGQMAYRSTARNPAFPARRHAAWYFRQRAFPESNFNHSLPSRPERFAKQDSECFPP